MFMMGKSPFFRYTEQALEKGQNVGNKSNQKRGEKKKEEGKRGQEDEGNRGEEEDERGVTCNGYQVFGPKMIKTGF